MMVSTPRPRIQLESSACVREKSPADATDSITIDPFKPPFRVPFFKGVRARGGLFVQNERVGALYLKFHLPKKGPSG